MKKPLLLLAVVPAVFLSSCYVTPDGGPYGNRPPPRSDLGGYRGSVRPSSGYDRDHRDHDHDRDRRDDDRYGRDGRGSSSSYRDSRGGPGPGSSISLPRGARRVEYRGSTYYTSGDSWYRASGSGYVRVSRPY